VRAGRQCPQTDREEREERESLFAQLVIFSSDLSTVCFATQHLCDPQSHARGKRPPVTWLHQTLSVCLPLWASTTDRRIRIGKPRVRSASAMLAVTFGAASTVVAFIKIAPRWVLWVVLKVGYPRSNHTVGYDVAGVFCHHDRSRFHVIAILFARNQADPLYACLILCCICDCVMILLFCLIDYRWC
jgi:hypothetical protein